MGELTDEDEIEVEIVRSSELRTDMQQLITQIGLLFKKDSVRSREEREPSRNNFAKLPKLSLKSFSGNTIAFQSFWDSFNAAVHENKSLEDITKFNYLKSFLQGPALSSINGLSLTAENYEEAVKLLIKRYGNKQVLISAHIEKLLNLTPVISINDVKRIRKLYDEIEAHTRNLKSLSVNTDKYGPVLVSIVMSKLPSEIKLVISREMSISDEWIVDELMEALKREIESREMCLLMSSMSQNKRQESREKHDYFENDEDQFTSSNLYAGNEKLISCTYCRKNHPSSKFTVITDIKARKAILRNKAKCFVCLKSGHLARQCRSNISCYKCHQKHHISICEHSPKVANESKSEEPSSQFFSASKGSTLLQTAQAIISSNSGKSDQIRVLLDSGSQKSFINENLSKTLNLPVVRKEKMILKSFESKNENVRTLDVVSARIRGLDNSASVEVELYVVPKICSPLSEQTIELAQVTHEHLIDLKMADFNNGSSDLKIDVLIGGNFYWKFMTGEVKSGSSGPVAVVLLRRVVILLVQILCRVMF